MVENSKLNSVPDGDLPTYKHCLAKIVCNPPSMKCCIGICSSCPGVDELKTTLIEKFEERIEKVTFRQWISTDRCSLKTSEIEKKSSIDFTKLFCEKLSALVFHDFVAKQQSSFLNDIKNNLKEGEYCVVGDYSENYSFVMQGEAHGYHWASNHATVHLFVVYYREDSKLEHVSYVIISDFLEHNTAAIYCFQKKLINFLKNKFEFIKKMY